MFEVSFELRVLVSFQIIVFSPIDSVTFIAMTSVAAFLELLVLTAMFAWWLADVIIFATNKRLSGNKCVLKHM